MVLLPLLTCCRARLTITLALCHQWSVFRHSRGLEGLNAIKAEILKSAMSVRLSWYAVLYAGATFYAFNFGPRLRPQLHEPLRLFFKDQALQCLRNEILENKPASDETLLSIAVLACHGTGEIPKLGDSKKSWTTSILSIHTTITILAAWRLVGTT